MIVQLAGALQPRQCGGASAAKWDIGAGLPAEGPVHEVARHHHPEARVVIVDHDPVVRVHAEALLADRPDMTGVVEADMREPETVFAHPEVTGRLDLPRPVGLLLVAVLHVLKDEQAPYALVRRYLEHLPPGPMWPSATSSATREGLDDILPDDHACPPMVAKRRSPPGSGVSISAGMGRPGSGARTVLPQCPSRSVLLQWESAEPGFSGCRLAARRRVTCIIDTVLQ
ncbi:SAM-dependent methyltransferase [Streptomonospora litoralis]|uniref:S-adenosyl methyltransferase n=1 Tax=Streptomonospora litoralis TaxID=2498135 RepID=A0A4P6QAT4_9ACTN|nr:SAM-dependent methyltransferase [Streptomonospora litoralis]QBI56427.1 S-adenosyl methyltransferase [Streptomonospora litoralis]